MLQSIRCRYLCAILAATLLAFPIQQTAAADLPLEVEQKYVKTRKDVQRTALVIGNWQYQLIDGLPNGKEDADEVARILRQLGFKTDVHYNQDREHFVDAVLKFRDQIEQDAIVFFYYSGHGFSLNGENYMAPIDHDPGNQPELRYTNLPVEWLIGELRSRRYGSIILALDSCRTPKPATPGAVPKGPGGDTGTSTYIVPQASKALISFATAPTRPAWTDEREKLSTFTGALAPLLPKEGEEIQIITRMVRRAVHTKSRGAQEPWDNSSLYGAIYLNPGAAIRQRDADNWRRVLQNPDRDSVASFIDTYPSSQYVKSARQWLDDNRSNLAKASYSTTSLSAAGASNPPTQGTVLQGSLQTPDIRMAGPRGLEIAFPSTSQPLFAGTGAGQRVVGTLESSKPVRILREPDAAGWAQVENADGTIGFVPNVRSLKAAMSIVDSLSLEFAAETVSLSGAQKQQLSAFGTKNRERKQTSYDLQVGASHPESFSVARQVAFGRAMEIRNALIEAGIVQQQISISLAQAASPAETRNSATINVQNVKW